MNLIIRIARTELATLFYSPIAWFILVVFSVLTASDFVAVISGAITSYDLGYYKDTTYSFSSFLFNGPYAYWFKVVGDLYMFIPLLTMGLISRETSSGSIKLLYSSPVYSSQIVIGKYFASIAFGLVLLISPILSAVCSSIFIPHFDWLGVLPGLLGLFLLICTYCSIGLFMSSLTSYQVVAAVGTLIIFAVLNLIGSVAQEYDFVREITYWLSVPTRTFDMLSGLIRSEDIFYFLIVISMFLVITILKIKFSRISVSRAKKSLSYLAVVVTAFVCAYITSRPSMVGFVDATRTKTETITAESQGIVNELEGAVTITNYVNLLDGKSFNYLPIFINNNKGIFADFLRFKPDLKVKYVYYYDQTLDGVDRNKIHSGKTLEEIRDYMCLVYNLNIRMFKSPEEIKKIINLAPFNNSFIRVVERENGDIAYLRDYNDNQRTPSEAEICAVFQKMVSTPPKVAFIVGDGQREINKPGDRDFSSFTTNHEFRYALINQGFDVTQVDISKGGVIDDDINIVVLSDMKQPMTQMGLETLDKYIARGGNMLISTDVNRSATMQPILSRFGVEAESDVIVQPLGDFYPDLLLAKASEESKELAKGFMRMIKSGGRVAMPGAVALTDVDSSIYQKVAILQTNSKGAWIERESKDMKNDKVILNVNANEQEEVYTSAFAVSRDIDGKEQRVMIFGDTDWMSNAELSISRVGYRSANFNMIVESFRWLSNGEFPIEIERPDCTDNKLTAIVKDISIINTLFLYIIPALMIACGVTLWLIRRRN